MKISDVFIGQLKSIKIHIPNPRGVIAKPKTRTVFICLIFRFYYKED